MKARVLGAFRERFGGEPDFVVRSPGRVNLIGEHTDYNEGHVLPMAIERAIWLAARARRDDRVQVHSLEEPRPENFSLSGFSKSTPGWGEYVKGMARAFLDSGHSLLGWEGVLTSDLPIGSGLSSSAALEMAVGTAFMAVSDFSCDGVSMARMARTAENEWIGARTGIMDPLISVLGRAGHALWIDCRTLSMEPVPMPKGASLLVMDTRTRHDHSTSGYNDRRIACERASVRLGVSHLRDLAPEELSARSGELDAIDQRRARHVVSENGRVLAMVDAMRRGDPVAMGRLMDASHDSLRDDFEVTNHALDEIVRIARAQSGCHGARMTGGGFGGCAIALVEEKSVARIESVVRLEYESAMGLRPDLFPTRASDGTRLV